MLKAQIKYKARNGKVSRRIIQPHYLVLGYPVWYALCWDELRADRRTFRLDRIIDIKLTDDHFTLRPYTDFEDIMHGVDVMVP